MKRLISFYAILGILFFPTLIKAQSSEQLKPQWITELPRPTNSTYQFVVIKAYGESPQAASQACFNQLVSNEDLRTSVQAIVNRNRETVQHQDFINGKLNEHISNVATMNITMNGKIINVTANKVDEYWEYITINGEKTYQCYTLYMIAVPAIQPIYDKISFSHNYGAQAAIRSLVPGWAQLYKGSTTKGLCIIGGEIASIAGIVISENLRSSYIRKVKEQPQHAQTYSSKSSNCKNIRNACIGAAAAIYIYNIIDAIAAKGAKRIIVVPTRHRDISMIPTYTQDGFEIGLTLKF